jgi:hypothetical protein
MLGLIALVAYRKHRNKKSDRELANLVADLIRALSIDTDTDFKTLAYDKDLLRLITSGAEYDELVDYIDYTYTVIGHA